MILIVGGGFTGVGVGLGLKRLGWNNFLILEKNKEILSETSNSSFRLVHSGIRHLQRLNLMEFIRTKLASRDFVEEFREAVQPVQIYARMPFLDRLGLFTRPLEKMVGGLIVQSNYFGCFGKYLTWIDYLIVDLPKIRGLVYSRLAGRIQTGTPVTKIKDGKIETDKGVFAYEKLILACFPSFMNELEPVYGWNVVCKEQFIEGGICVGYPTAMGRYIFAVKRDTGTSFGTWYSEHYPNAEILKHSIQEIRMQFGVTLNDYDFEIGVLPAKSGKIIQSSVTYVEDNVYKIYPAKFTSCVRLGRALARKLIAP